MKEKRVLVDWGLEGGKSQTWFMRGVNLGREMKVMRESINSRAQGETKLKKEV